MSTQRISVGGLYFDAVFRTDHTKELTKTEHPVEYGADITDHAFIEPDKVSIEIGMSDVVSGSGSSVNLYEALRELQATREPFPVVTRLHSYDNMLITSISSPDDFTTTYGLKSTIYLEEIILVHTGTVQVAHRASSEPHKTNATNNGTQQPQTADDGSTNQSVLSQIADNAKSLLFGPAA